MKLKAHVPVEEYGFVEVEVDESEARSIRDVYRDIKNEFRVKDGLPRLEWNKVLDSYLKEQGMTTDQMESLGEAQSWMIHELDKAKGRLSN